VGDRNPRQYDFTVQLLALDSSKSGANTGVGTLIALCSALLQKSLKGGLIVAGNINLGGSIEPLYNPVNIAELAIEKGATTLLVPVSARKQMIDLPDTQATKINVTFYSDALDALVKALIE
jgi:ATP-dependent Lon protease